LAAFDFFEVYFFRKKIDTRGIENFINQEIFNNLDCDKKVESADKPGSVVDSHLSGTFVAKRLEQPTRT
jgi:hypothetical protein